MDLILWRHAEAGEPAEGGEAGEAIDGDADLLRPLTPRGDKQAQRMAEWLNRVLPHSTRILVSPARRTRQTAEALGRKFRIEPALLPGCTPEQLLSAARWPNRREPVLVVGHQPTLGRTAAMLMGADAGNSWSVRKGATWWFRHRERDGRESVTLVSVRPPQDL